MNLDDKRKRCANVGCAFAGVPIDTERSTCLGCGRPLEHHDPLTRLLRDLGF